MQRFWLRSSSARKLRTNTTPKDHNSDVIHSLSSRKTPINHRRSSAPTDRDTQRGHVLMNDKSTDTANLPTTTTHATEGLPPRYDSHNNNHNSQQRRTLWESQYYSEDSPQRCDGRCRSATPGNTLMNSSSLQCGVYRPSLFHLEREHNNNSDNKIITDDTKDIVKVKDNTVLYAGGDRHSRTEGSPEPTQCDNNNQSSMRSRYVSSRSLQHVSRPRPVSSLAPQFSVYDHNIADGSYLRGCGSMAGYGTKDILQYKDYIKAFTPSARAADDDWAAMMEQQRIEKENKIKLRDQLHNSVDKQLQQAMQRREEERRQGKAQRILIEDASYQEKLKNYQQKVMARAEIKAQMRRDEELTIARRKEDQQRAETERRETTEMLLREKEREIKEREEKIKEQREFLTSGWEVQQRERQKRLEKALLEKKNEKINIDNFERSVAVEARAKKAAELQSEMELLQGSKRQQTAKIANEKRLQKEFDECERQRISNAQKEAEEERKQTIMARTQHSIELKKQMEEAVAKKTNAKMAEMMAIRQSLDAAKAQYEKEKAYEKRMLAIKKQEFAVELEKQMRYNLQSELQRLAAE